MATKKVKPALPETKFETGKYPPKGSTVKRALPEAKYYQKPVGKKKVKPALARHAVLANKRVPRKRG